MPHHRSNSRAVPRGIQTGYHARMATESSREVHALDEVGRVLNHDLRAPIRHVRGFTQLVLDEHGATLPPDARELLSRSHAAAERLGGMVDLLVEYIRFITRPPATRPIPLGELLLALESRAAPRVRSRGGLFRVDAPDVSLVDSDRDTLLRALDLLVEATARHGGNPPVVRVEIERGADVVHLDVVGEGPGAAAPDPRLLVDLLAPGGAAREAGASGLALAARATEAAGGTLSLLPGASPVRFRISLRAVSASDEASAPSTRPAG